MKIYLDSQEQDLLLRLYDYISLQLCLDIPPTKSLKDKKLIEVASVCNETINGKSNYFYFKLSDSCRLAIKNKGKVFENDFLEIDNMQNHDINTNKKDKTIFVSHRSIDKDIADKLIDYLAILGIPQNCFFCSSLPGNDVIAKISDEVKQGLTDSLINIVILSKDYYESAYCLNEAGIIWYQNKITIVVALPEINEKNMFGFLDSNFKLRRLSEKEDLVAIYDTIANALKLERTNLQLLQRKTSSFASEFLKILKNNQ